MENNIHYYELCFFGYEDKDVESENACSYVIKTEIHPLKIGTEAALAILFGKGPREDWMEELYHNCTCVREISETEALACYDIEDLNQRTEDEYGIYYTRKKIHKKQ